MSSGVFSFLKVFCNSVEFLLKDKSFKIRQMCVLSFMEKSKDFVTVHVILCMCVNVKAIF
jgi:hypothetical protein